jgi:ribonuclease Y
MSLVIGVVVGVVAAAVTAVAVAGRKRNESRVHIQRAKSEAQAVSSAGQREAAALKRAAETEAREQSLSLRADADAKLAKDEADLAVREEKLYDREDDVGEYQRDVAARDAELTARHQAILANRDRAKGIRKHAQELRTEALSSLEAKTGANSTEVGARLAQQYIEDAQASAAQMVRNIEQGAQDSANDREAQRMLNIAIGRYRNHFLTERLISNIPVRENVCEKLSTESTGLLEAIQGVSNVQLNVSEDGNAVRLEGLDGVGREIARRALSRLQKRPRAMSTALEEPVVWVEKIKSGLEQEILNLGRRAFKVLGVARAHPEIVDLVGRLNWRTSYTQNQWLHAVEASFLAGMMAGEMGLDVKLARRATLLHDIGKALTHKIDGSHAVIGADIARRLGEDELVANAIGAHHLDEPMNSVYAHLVAAADAMSGARPGARREQTEGYSSRIQDLERIGRRYRGVDRCFAVHGGRELRVYVRENAITDLEAVELSNEIAEQVSEELVFPGQIKVTVIRAIEAVATAS